MPIDEVLVTASPWCSMMAVLTGLRGKVHLVAEMVGIC